jgi:hypothetical protein
MRITHVAVLLAFSLTACGQTAPTDDPEPDAEPPPDPDAGCTSQNWYADCDGDGVASLGGEIRQACVEPPPPACGGGWTATQPVTGAADCNDTRNDIYPGASEPCDGDDNDCDGSTDEEGQSTFYQDADGDSFGNPNVNMVTCNAPSDYVANGMDCNDTRPDINPGAAEACDGLDNNCNITIDEGVLLTFYGDEDFDGYGNPGITTTGCSAPPGYVSNNTDCNDVRADAYPGAMEWCDYIDNDCDTQIDEGTLTTFYFDYDHDGYGNTAFPAQDCSAPTNYVTTGGDCNDGRSDIYPNAPEYCDLADNDCDASIDEGVQSTFYGDADGDGYGNPSQPTQACSAPGGYVANNSDCNDFASTTNPGAAEVCFDGADNNCSGAQDEVAQCSISCNWTGARWLSQGYDGGNAAYVGAWVSCQNSKITFMDTVVNNPPGNGPVSPPPSPSGTTDNQVGCNWGNANRWAGQGWDGAASLSYGADLTCSGGRVTSMTWENNQIMPTQTAPFTSGQLGCDWTGAIFLSHGIDGNCAWYTGFQVTCHNQHITNFQWIEQAGCGRMRD